MLGGVNPNGGYGTVTGVVLSAFTLQMVSSGFNQVGWNAFMYQIAQGGDPHRCDRPQRAIPAPAPAGTGLHGSGPGVEPRSPPGEAESHRDRELAPAGGTSREDPPTDTQP